MFREEWNHNIHYYDYLLKHLSESKSKVLDIGSGNGQFSYKLSESFDEVYSLELNNESIEYSKNKYKNINNIHYLNEDFISYDFKDEKFDCIVAIASIHHMDFETALHKMKDLLNPNGRIIILGLYKEKFISDYALSLLAIISNKIRTALSKRTLKNDEETIDVVTTTADMNINEIKTLSTKILGDVKVKRHLYWRYSIIWVNQNTG